MIITIILIPIFEIIVFDLAIKLYFNSFKMNYLMFVLSEEYILQITEYFLL